MKKKIERIIDFLDSFFYYPKMKRYFIDKGLFSYNPWQYEKFARIKYAWWHCHHGKLRD